MVAMVIDAPVRPAPRHAEDFVAYAGTSAMRLRNTAYSMCRDWHLAQDLTQVTLTKLFIGWGRASQAASVDAYAHTTLLRSYLDHRRRRSATEQTGAWPPEESYRDSADLRITLLDALQELPARDRAILILRFWEDCSVERVAAVLDLPISAVKTRTRRALAKLRVRLDPEQLSLFG
jgi:RNA polymerase sigma factor (sigma-70 family)